MWLVLRIVSIFLSRGFPVDAFILSVCTWKNNLVGSGELNGGNWVVFCGIGVWVVFGGCFWVFRRFFFLVRVLWIRGIPLLL